VVANHHCGGVGSVVANHHYGGESSVVVTTLHHRRPVKTHFKCCWNEKKY